MSNISSIFDRVYSIITTNFSTKTELKNPYELIDNDDCNLKNGYGVAWGSVEDLEVIRKQAINLRRNLVITFTKKIYTTEQNTSARKTAEKALMEDELTLINLISDDFDLKKYAEDVKFVGDDGISFIFDDRQNYLAVSMSFDVDYTEFINN